MKRLLAALAATAFLCLPVAAQEEGCQPGMSFEELSDEGGLLVDAGVLSEALILQGQSMERYVESLESLLPGLVIPDGLSHVIVAIPVEGDKVQINGFHDGCRTGGVVIPKQVHMKAYGQEVGLMS